MPLKRATDNFSNDRFEYLIQECKYAATDSPGLILWTRGKSNVNIVF